ncbi:hypothetical protein F4819DRAFT_503619 [Hypoxylon fuscum]|nr:hypothetical protein F4819DRAFT_503619 [Hypoxylon fuscum]
MPYIPTEILSRIFSLLRPDLLNRGYGNNFGNTAPGDVEEQLARRLALSRISRSSKRFRQVSLPVLYHTIPKISAKLLVNLVKYNSLAQMVKAIDISKSGLVPRDVLRDALEATRHRLFLPGLEDLERRLFQCIKARQNYMVEEVLFTILLPNVETVAYFIEEPENDILFDFFRCMARSDRLPQLRHLRLLCGSGEDTMHISNVQEMLLPTIQTLRGCGICWEINPVEGGQPRPPYALSNRLGLRHIDLVDAVINGTGLSDLLSRCRDLRTLRIVWGDDERMSFFRLDFGAMGTALRKHARQLEKLALDPLKDPIYPEAAGRLGSLHRLTKLKTLRIPQNMLVGDFVEDEEGNGYLEKPLTLDQTLPDSLESLHLLSCIDNKDMDLDEQVCSLITGGQMANLRTIQMKRYQAFSGNVAAFGWTVRHHRDNMILTASS